MKKQTIKRVGIFVFLNMIALFSQAQGFDFSGGIVGGVSTGAVKLGNLDTSFAGAIEGRNVKGFEAGIYAKPSLGPFYARPELLYDFNQGNVTVKTTTPGDGSTVTQSFSMHKLEVPVLFGVQFLGPLFVEAGPVYHYILGVTENYGNRTVDVSKSGLGYQVGAGLDFGVVMFNLNYSGATYNTMGVQRATFSEPSRVTFGAAVRLGSIAK